MAASARTTELLAQIADALGVPVATFTAPPPPAAEIVPAAQIATLVFDPEGRRLAAAFARLTDHARTSLTNVAEALCGDEAADRPQRTEEWF